MIFIILSILQLYGEYTLSNNIINIIKPLLIPCLYYEFHENLTNSIIIGLFFATLGDTLLLKKEDKKCFKLGIISFIMNHVMNIYHFTSLSTIMINFYYITPMLLCNMIAFKIIGKNIDNIIMKKLVNIYISIIVISLYVVLQINNYYIIIGYLSYILSDIMIGLNIGDENYEKNKIFNVMIMMLYLTGQYLIISNV
jgi:uncharacterized membrane protein YhhN